MLVLIVVNATALLTALGLNTAQVTARLQETTTPWSQNRHLNSSVCPTNGKIHSSGVAGVWVHFAEALELVKSFKKHEERLMSTILKEDLFQMVRAKSFPAWLGAYSSLLSWPTSSRNISSRRSLVFR